MFKPKTNKIQDICVNKVEVIEQLERLLNGRVNMYIDYANVKGWFNRLGWHIDIGRLRQFLQSFDNLEKVNFYYGELVGNENSEREIKEVASSYFSLRTKRVKIMKHSIDYTSINAGSSDLLVQFIRKALLRKYTLETVEYLNYKFKEMNDKGQFYIEDRKCNFDVEIGVDMLLDCERNNVDTFILWSGDSDFEDSVKKILERGKKVILFATVRHISKELNELRKEGLFIFDIKKIDDFICRNSEIQKSKGDCNNAAPKL